MKAAVHLALFFISVYDYMFSKKSIGEEIEEPQPDNPYHADLENDTSTDYLSYNHNDQYKSMKVSREGTFASLLYPDAEFDDNLPQESKLTGIKTGIKDRMKRVWNGSKQIMNNYVNARTYLDDQTIENSDALKNAKEYLSKKTSGVTGRFSRAMYARNAYNDLRTKFGDQFNTL